MEEKALVTLRGAVTARREEEGGLGAGRSRWCNAIGSGAGWGLLGSEPAIFRFHDEPSRRACCETERKGGEDEWKGEEGDWNNKWPIRSGPCLDMKERNIIILE